MAWRKTILTAERRGQLDPINGFPADPKPILPGLPKNCLAGDRGDNAYLPDLHGGCDDGRAAGEISISAVGLTNQPKQIILTVITSLNIGVMAAAGRLKGQGDQDAVNRCLKTSILISMSCAALMSALALVFDEKILFFCGADEVTVGPAIQYFRFLAVGNFFSSIGLTITAVQRGCGNTRISLYTNLTANLVNIVFNYLLIGGNLGFPALGVRGAGLATMLGNIVGFGIAVFSVWPKDNPLTVRGRCGLAEKSTIDFMRSVGGSSIVERLCLQIGMLMFVKIIASLGIAAMAAYTICQRFLNFTSSIGYGLNVGAGALAAQSLGAGEVEDAKRYSVCGIRIALATAAIFLLGMLVGMEFLIPLFTDAEAVQELCRYGVMAIALMAFLHIPQMVQAGVLRCAGDGAFIAKQALIGTAIIRPISAWFFGVLLAMGFNGIWWGMCADFALRLCFSTARFLHGKWCCPEKEQNGCPLL